MTDWFTPGNQKTLNQQDLDLGTGGPVGLPGTSNLVGVSKQGMLYVLNTGNLGHFTNQNRQIPRDAIGPQMGLPQGITAQTLGGRAKLRVRIKHVTG